MILKDEMEKQGNWLFKFRGILPIIILVFCGYKYIQTVLHPEIYLFGGTSYEIYYEIICLIVSIIGLIIRVITVGHTPKNTSGRNVDGQVADELNTTGMYSIVRNPLYLGNFLMWLGIAMLTMDIWFVIAFILLFWVYYERIIFAEEQYLIRKFGTIYEDWAAKTPCFIPRCKGYVKSSLKFSWKKAVKKEKNGLLAVLLVFCAFDVLGTVILGETPKCTWLVITTGIALVLYLVIKFIKHKTTLLDESGR